MAKASEHKAGELQKMSNEQLAIELKDTKDNFFRLRLLAQTERLDAPSELRKHRRQIARIKTVQRQRELAADATAKAAAETAES